MYKVLIVLLLSLLTFSKELNITPSNFYLKEYNKKDTEVTLDDFKGKKVLINFWASWCVSCVEEVPELNALMTSSKAKNYHFIGLNAGDTKRKIKKFIKRRKFKYRTLIDRDRSVSKQWGVDALPVTVILDEYGKVIFQGIRPPKELL